MLDFQFIRHLPVVTLAIMGLLGITASIGLLATARPALAADKTADLAKYCRKLVGPTAFPTVDRRDNGLMCSRRTHRGRGLLHLKITAAEVCAAQYHTRRFRRQGKGLICITGSGGGVRTARTIDLKRHCRARYGRRAFLTRRRADNRPMCTIRTHNRRGLRHHLIDLARLCGGGSPRAVGSKLFCGGGTAGTGARGGGGQPGSWGRRAGPLPTPRRKGGGRLTKADFRGCSNDRAIMRRKVRVPGSMKRHKQGYDSGSVPTPCPALIGGRVLDLAALCRIGNNRLVYVDGKVPACVYTASGTARNPMFLALPNLCWRASGLSKRKSRAYVFVFKYANRRLECFYFKRARFMAIMKRGNRARGGGAGQPITVQVPGTACLFLAGVGKGGFRAYGDSLPKVAPVAVKIPAHARRVVLDVSGRVGNCPGCFGAGFYTTNSKYLKFGISPVRAPLNSLIGVFLGNDNKIKGGKTKHSNPKNKTNIMGKSFFVHHFSRGNGRNTFSIPNGARVLYLGTMDGYGWNDNVGKYVVRIRFIQKRGKRTRAPNTPVEKPRASKITREY